MLTYCFEASHCKEISHHRGESWSQAALSNKTKFELCQTDHIVASLPIPTGDV